MNGTHLSWITPTLPQLVAPPGGAHDPRIDKLTHSPGNSNIAQHKHAITTQPIDFEKHRPYFGWVNKHTIEKIFNKTTQ